jgi:hypothetical protein
MMTIWGFVGIELLLLTVMAITLKINQCVMLEEYARMTVYLRAVKTIKINRIFIWFVYLLPPTLMIFLKYTMTTWPFLEIIGIIVTYLGTIMIVHESTWKCLNKCHDENDYGHDASWLGTIIVKIIRELRSLFLDKI